jgi:hypothetical protein
VPFWKLIRICRLSKYPVSDKTLKNESVIILMVSYTFNLPASLDAPRLRSNLINQKITAPNIIITKADTPAPIFAIAGKPNFKVKSIGRLTAMA